MAVPEAVAEWEKARGEYQRQLGPLMAAIKGSSIEPLSLDCTETTADLMSKAVAHMESKFILYICYKSIVLVYMYIHRCVQVPAN